jgi:predicted NBD/HSP70 family sugar kinase
LLCDGYARAENPYQAHLLKVLRDRGSLSRAAMSETIGLSRTKVSVELDRLAQLRLINSGGLAPSLGGRRPAIVGTDPDVRFVGVDIGATSVDVAVTDGELRLLGRLSDSINVRQEPDMLSQELGCPVMVDNDVNIMALGEMHAGTARSVEDFLFIKLGTSIGCGIVLQGQLHRGPSGSAGDIGHLQVENLGPACACGNVGCLEAFFSGAALERDALQAARSGQSPALADRLESTGFLTAVDVGVAASSGDPVAVALVRDGARRLGQVIAALVSFINPALVVIGGGVANLGHSLLAEVRSVVYQRSLPLATGNLPIVLSGLPTQGGVIGGARLISDAVLCAPRSAAP